MKIHQNSSDTAKKRIFEQKKVTTKKTQNMFSKRVAKNQFTWSESVNDKKVKGSRIGTSLPSTPPPQRKRESLK